MTDGPDGSDFDRIIAPGAATATAEPEQQPQQRPRRRKKSRKWLWFLIVLLLVLVLVAVAAFGYVSYLGRQWDQGTQKLDSSEIFGEQSTGTADDGEDEAASADGTNILLLGSDARAAGLDYTSTTGNRSDTILVAHIPEKGDGMQIMSIPRDMWVPIEGYGEAKINAAMSYGGLPLTVRAVSDFIDVDIDHVAVIDMEGFKGLTDALGGVTVESEHSFTSAGYSFVEGSNDLDGEAALAFVRARKNFSDGDFQRNRNQQAFLKGVIDKVLSADTLSNPQKISQTVSTFSPYVTVDDGLDSGALTQYAIKLRSMGTNGVDFFSAPTAGTGTSSDGQSIVNVDQERLEELRTAFDEGTVAEYAEAAPDEHL
ncbi:LCP family protein [Brevibacterium litoralis]|uniref:LCP family protein n=1 Tax=Brevibacterium litoralis TaxID=3138935 RepID=UPI0032EE1714